MWMSLDVHNAASHCESDHDDHLLGWESTIMIDDRRPVHALRSTLSTPPVRGRTTQGRTPRRHPALGFPRGGKMVLDPYCCTHVYDALLISVAVFIYPCPITVPNCATTFAFVRSTARGVPIPCHV